MSFVQLYVYHVIIMFPSRVREWTTGALWTTPAAWSRFPVWWWWWECNGSEWVRRRKCTAKYVLFWYTHAFLFVACVFLTAWTLHL